MKREWSRKELAGMVDHTLLKAQAGEADLRRHCAEARRYGFAAVCVNPCWVGLAAAELEGSGIGVTSVVGYPLGANSTETKAAEASLAAAQGATGIDMVMNIGFAKSGDWKRVAEDIAAVVHAARPIPVKVIIETCQLDREEKVLACRAALAAGADCVMTSTGFGTGGATVEDIALMRQTLGETLKIKASGGIRTRSDAIALLEAGAYRIGASAGVAIVAGAED